MGLKLWSIRETPAPHYYETVYNVRIAATERMAGERQNRKGVGRLYRHNEKQMFSSLLGLGG
jgi:hypothetical protein